MNRTGERWCGEDWPRVFCGLSVPAVTLLVMPRVMAVAFEQYGRLHYLDPGGVDYHVGDWVLYPTDDGAEVARVVWAPEETTLEAPLPRCLGRATKADLRRDETNREHRRRIHEVAVERIAAHGLPMKVMATDYIDSSKEYDKLAVIYFTAPGSRSSRGIARGQRNCSSSSSGATTSVFPSSRCGC